MDTEHDSQGDQAAEPGVPQAVGFGEQGAQQRKAFFTHLPHPHIARRKKEGPVRRIDQMDRSGPFARLNSRVAIIITVAVGSMWCAYLFTLIALVSLPAALATRDKIVIISWIAQTFLQLVLLPIIIVGQNIQGAASDKRAQQTYDDAEAVLHEALQIQQHLTAQDAQLLAQGKRLEDIIAALQKAYPTITGGAAAATTD